MPRYTCQRCGYEYDSPVKIEGMAHACSQAPGGQPAMVEMKEHAHTRESVTKRSVRGCR